LTNNLPFPISILDLAAVGEGETIAESFAGSVKLAQLAEKLGYKRVWYAEHHSINSIASSATSVLIAHVGAQTSTIRLGAGGIMLPNHAPMLIAEQFGTLETLYPGRIDLGLGRAPGSDQLTARALRRDAASAERFPQDVLELQAWLSDESPFEGVRAIPGEGTHVPLYILGSSTFGAQLAAQLGLPYAFASHFAPRLLQSAIDIYRRTFQPSVELAEPYVIAGVGVLAAETSEIALAEYAEVRRNWAREILSRGGGPKLSLEEVDLLLGTPRAAMVDEMLHFTACGNPQEVVAYLQEFQRISGADELITAHRALSVDARLRSVRLLAEALQVAEVTPAY
jgi:luciferase family oxidoreductase group 1